MTAFRRIKTVVLLAALLPLTALAQGWPAQYGGVMLQGFFWNSYYPYDLNGERRTTDADKTWAVMNWSDANNPKWSFPVRGQDNNMKWEVPITTWSVLEANVNNISPYIDVMWVPQSGANTAPQMYENLYPGQLNPDCMGFVPVYWFNHGKKDSNGNYYTATWSAPNFEGSVKGWENPNATRFPEESAEVKSYFGSEDELRSMIRAYQNAPGGGTKVIMDVILNHKGGIDYWSQYYNSQWMERSSFNFPWENSNKPDANYTQNGYDITWSPKDICQDDELFVYYNSADPPIGDWFTAADKGAADTADKGGWARDLDHTSAHVQYNINRYLDFLLNDLGYDGLRIDYVKGFSGNYMGKFLNEAGPSFSVGECYDGSATTVGDWVRSTTTAGAIQSAAFDFPLKFVINAAFSKRIGTDGQTQWHKWSYLGNGGMINDWQLKRYAVTFVDNHDTFKNLPHDQHHQSPNNGGDDLMYTYEDHGGGNGTNGNDRLNFMMEEANAYILCMPGTPCLFYPHFMHPQWGVTIRKMIRARRTAGITNMSGLYPFGTCNDDGGGWRVVGDKYEIIYQVGDNACGNPPAGYTKIWDNNDGRDYVSEVDSKLRKNKVRVLISSTISAEELANITYHGDGSLAGQLQANNLKANVTYGYAIVDKPSGTYQNSVTVNVRPNRNGVVLVYTTDGSTPTASSRQITQATDLTYTKDVTLKVGVLTGDKVVNSTIESRNYYISSSAVSTLHVYLQATTDHLALYAWDANGTVQDWISASASSIHEVTIGGRKWYDFPINSTNFNFCIRYDNSETRDGDGNITNIGGVQAWNEQAQKKLNSPGVGDYLGVTQDVFLHINGQEYTDVTASYIAMANDPLVSIDKASGTYDVGTLTVNLNSNNSKYPIVYTTDGTAPTTSSTQATLSKVLALGTGSHTIRAGILKDGQVINTVARRYTVNAAAAPTNIKIYVKNMTTDDDVYIHYWNVSGLSNTEKPGVKMTTTKTVAGQTWKVYTFNATSASFQFMLSNYTPSQSGNITISSAGEYFYYYYPGGYLNGNNRNGSNGYIDVTSDPKRTTSKKVITVYTASAYPSSAYAKVWWGDENNGGITSYPGLKLSDMPSTTIGGATRYYFSFIDKEGVNIQFNNNNNGGYHGKYAYDRRDTNQFYTYPNNDNWGDAAFDTATAPDRTENPTTVTSSGVEVDQLPSCATYVPGAHYIYFENDVDGVIAPFAYPYTDKATGGAKEFAGSWPGEQLIEPVGTAPNGNPIYRFTIVDNEAPAKLIFNNLGGNDQANPKQSDSYTWVDGGYYSYNGGSQGTVSGSGSAETATEMSMRDIIANGTVGSKYTISNNVTCVKAQQVGGTWYLWVKDTDAEGFNRYEPTSDAMRENALANTKGHTVGKDENKKFRNVYHYDLLYKEENGNLVNNFDQSNWMKIKLTGSAGITASDYEGKIIEGSTITGTYTDVDNPTLEINLLPIVGGTAEAYTPNKYTPANFISHDGEYADWFFMRPRVQEYAEVWYAKWDGEKFVMPDEDDAPGELWMKDNLSGVGPVKGTIYKLEGFIENKVNGSGAGAPRRAPSTGGGYSISITAADGEVLTAVDDVKVERQAVGVRYVNLQGAQSAKPFDGINIVVTTYSDGTTSTTKVLY